MEMSGFDMGLLIVDAARPKRRSSFETRAIIAVCRGFVSVAVVSIIGLRWAPMLLVRFLRVFLTTLIGIIVLGACADGAARTVGVKTLQIGESEASLKKSRAAFAFAPNGHFGDKLQYNAREADEFGGAYAVHCRGGKSFGIEVKYPETGVPVADAKLVLARLLASAGGELVSSNREDLAASDVKEPYEFFYYKNNVRAEFAYASNSRDKVREISIWSQ